MSAVPNLLTCCLLHATFRVLLKNYQDRFNVHDQKKPLMDSSQTCCSNHLSTYRDPRLECDAWRDKNSRLVSDYSQIPRVNQPCHLQAT
jgi:hypothetical protein